MSESPPLKSTKLSAAGFIHGFFTRQGGTSRGNYDSLNCSYDVGDEPSCVTANLERVSAELGLDVAHLITVTQVHEATVEDFDERSTVVDFRTREADALTSGASEVGLAVRTADCVPLLVGCRVTGRAAAVHAGWRGIVAQVIGHAVQSLLREGSSPHSLVACIGPHIGQHAFAISPETAKLLASAAPNGAASIRFEGDTPRADLGQLAAAQLEAAGVLRSDIENLHLCTYQEERALFSYRRDGRASGRQLSVIRPR